ncbi:MAG: formyltetrahydrofolate deformylase [Solirubrobacteraceae bacterium]
MGIAAPAVATDLDRSGRPAGITRLLISCPDRPGIVAAVSSLLSEAGANIISSDQYSTDPVEGSFFMRTEFYLPLSERERVEFEARFKHDVGDPFRMAWRMWDTSRRKRMAILVSRHDHCLLDMLWRWRRGQLEADVELVVSNHPDLRADVETFGVRYEHVPIVKAEKQIAEDRVLDLLEDNVDIVVLARYMQILSGRFLEMVRAPVINIHHSFLPAFAGANPYERARERGVKLIGATAHYVTEELDAGPIIEQDVIRVSHRHTAAELVSLGADIERVVFARAVNWHCEDRVLVNGNTTIVF